MFVLKSISARGALGCVVEYQGSAVEALSIEERMTLCNLTVEAAIIASDEKAFEWVRSHWHQLDTDQIMSGQFLRGIDKAGCDKGLSYNLKHNADIVGAINVRRKGRTSPSAHDKRRIAREVSSVKHCVGTTLAEPTARTSLPAASAAEVGNL